MKKNLFVFLTALLLLPVMLKAQNDIIIGTDDVASSRPFCGIYANSWCETVYPADEIATAGNITALAWACSHVNPQVYSHLRIYLGTKTADTYVSSSDWTPMSELTLVYDATNITVGAAASWQTFTLDNPFFYDGSENLVVVVAKTMSHSSPTDFYYTSVSNTCLYRDNGSDAGCDSHPGFAFGTLDDCRSNIMITITPGSGGCPKPKNLTIGNVAENSATMQWQDSNAVSWDICLSTSETFIPDSNTVPTGYANITSYNFSGLNPNTEYYAYVRSHCSNNEVSGWRGTSFRTLQIPAQLPYSCDFEDSVENANWTLLGHYTNRWIIGTAVNSTENGQSALYVSNDNGVTNNYSNSNSTSWAYRDIDFDSTYAEYQVTFDFKGVGENASQDNLRVYIGSPATPNNNISSSATCPPGAVEIGNFYNESDWIHHTITLNSSYSGVQRLYFLWRNDIFTCNPPAASVDNLTITGTNCGAPYNLAAGSLTDSSATFTFHPATSDDNSWQAVLIAHGDFLDESQAVTISDTSFAFDNLLANTCYDMCVRTDCGGEYSLWSPVLEFCTPCSDYMNIPYAESFDSYGIGTNIFPTCWTKLTNYSYPYPYPYISSLFFSSPGSLAFASSADDSLYTCAIAPEVNVSATPVNTLTVFFKISKFNSAVGNGAIQVGVMTNPNDVSTFTPVQIFAGSEWENTNIWYDVEVPLTSYTGNGSHIALYVPGTADSYTLVDDFSVYPTPPCERPSSITASSTPADTVYVNWVDNGGALWDLIYGPSGFNPDSSTDAQLVSNITTTSYSVTGLAANVVYDFYVRRNCGNGLVSAWTSTPASAAAYVVTMGVKGYASVTGCELTIVDDGGLFGDYSNVCDYYLTIYPSSADSSISVSGTIQAESANFDYLKIYHGVCDENTAANATLLYQSNQTSSSNILTFGPITSTIGPLTIFFHSDNSGTYPGFVINATCVAGPSCRQPSNFIVTGTDASSVSLSWMENGSATAWNVAYGPAGFIPTAASTMELANDTFVTVYGLTPNILYDFYVQADCGSASSDWVGPLSITPGTYNMAVTGTYSLVMCNGIIYDNGGIYYDYSNDCNSILTVFPSDSNSYISISGTFAGEGNYDYLSVYQGTTADAAHFIQKITSTVGTSVNFGPITSESGPLTLLFYSDHSNSYSGFAINVNCVPAPSCRTPYDFSLQSVSSSDAIIEWSMSNNDYMGFNVTWGTSANFNPNVSPFIDVSTTTNYHFTGLTPNTTYYVKVQTDCGGGGVSEWTDAFAFTTSCELVSTLPYTDNFDTYGTAYDAFPNCWNYISTFTDYPPTLSTLQNYSAPSSISLYANGSNEHIAITPEFDASIPINTLEATFMLKTLNAAGGVIVGVIRDVTNVATFVPVDTVYAPIPTGTWAEVTVSFANYTGNGHHIAFRNKLSSYIYIDNLFINTIQTCLKPQDLTVTGTTGNSATLTWTEQGSATTWNLEYGPFGFTQGQGTLVVANSNPFTITGLSATSNYDVYIQADCGNATSNWSTATQFSTSCGSTAVPYLENFDSYPMTNPYMLAPDDYPNDPMPICWDFINRGNISRSFLTSRSGYSVSGNGLYIQVIPSTPLYAILPEFEDDISDLALSFYYRKNSTGTFMVGYMTDPNDATTFVPTYTINNEDQTSGMAQVQGVTFDNSPVGSRIAFKGQGTNSILNMSIDNIYVEHAPNCQRPQNLSASNITTHSVDLSWTEMGSATSWNIEFGPTGFTPGQGTTISANTNPLTITGLSSSFTYDFYVQADCGANDASFWSNVLTVATACDKIESFPYTENFDASTSLPTCWENVDVTNTTVWTVTAPNGYYVHQAHSGSKVALFFQDNDGHEASLQMPTLKLGNLINPRISFWYVNEAWSGDVDALTVFYRSSNSDPWTELASFTFGTSSWTYHSMELPNPSDSYQIKFQAVSHWGRGINLDDVTIEGDNIVTPTGCTVPADLTLSNITPSTAAVSWTPTGTETAWNLQYKQVSDTDWNNVFSLNTPYLILSNLTPNTQYQVRVQAVCDTATTSNWTSSVYFTTEEIVVEPCDSPADLTATEISNHDVTLSWTGADNVLDWAIYFSIEGTGVWNSQTATSHPYTLTGLEGNTPYDIFVMAHCADDHTSEPSDTIHISTTNIGIDDYESALVTVAPNPTTGVVRVSSYDFQISAVDVYDVYGKLLNTYFVKDNTVEVNLGQCAAGVYFIRVTGENGIVTKRIVKR